MPEHDQADAECLVFTFKDGLLSKIAHDLKLRVARWSIRIDDDTRAVEATFDTRSLELVCVRKDGRDAPGTLGRGDRRKIEAQIVDDVLHSRRHPEARFTSTEVEPQGDGFRIVGLLDLHGYQRELRATSRLEDGQQVVEVRLHQPDFGIKPFSAAFGTLKVQPTVTVRVSVPALTR